MGLPLFRVVAVERSAAGGAAWRSFAQNTGGLPKTLLSALPLDSDMIASTLSGFLPARERNDSRDWLSHVHERRVA